MVKNGKKILFVLNAAGQAQKKSPVCSGGCTHAHRCIPPSIHTRLGIYGGPVRGGGTLECNDVVAAAAAAAGEWKGK